MGILGDSCWSPSDEEEIVDAEAEDIADSDLIIGEHLGLAVARY